MQALIAACHARATTFAATDWPAITALYDALAQLSPSPVVELNRAVALSYTDGPAAALEIVDTLQADRRLARYHLLGAIRAALLLRLGRSDEAAEQYKQAIALAPTPGERSLLRNRMTEARRPPPHTIGTRHSPEAGST